MPTKCDRIVAIDSATSLHSMCTLRPHDVHSWRGRFPRVRCGGCACARATTYRVIGGDDDDDDDVARLLPPPPPRRICVIGRRRRRRRAQPGGRRVLLRFIDAVPFSAFVRPARSRITPSSRAHRRLPADNAELVMKFDEPRASTSPSSTRSLRPPARLPHLRGAGRGQRSDRPSGARAAARKRRRRSPLRMRTGAWTQPGRR